MESSIYCILQYTFFVIPVTQYLFHNIIPLGAEDSKLLSWNHCNLCYCVFHLNKSIRMKDYVCCRLNVMKDYANKIEFLDIMNF